MSRNQRTRRLGRALAATVVIALGLAVVPVGTSARAPQHVVRTAPAPGAPWDIWTVAGSGEVVVNWARPDGLSDETITGYRIQARVAGSEWRTVVADTSSDSTRRVVHGLSDGKRYRFRVAAFFGGGRGPWSTPSMPVRPGPRLHLGSTGARVIALQDALMMRGFDLTRDGIFGPATRSAVETWQGQMLLTGSGVVTPATGATLGLGSNSRPNSGTDDDVADAVARYLDGGSPGRDVAADARMALRSFRYTVTGASSTAPWTLLSISPAGDWGEIYRFSGLDAGGLGPVLLLDVCFTSTSPRTWCGIHGAFADS